LEKTMEADISNLRKTGHFYFALTVVFALGESPQGQDQAPPAKGSIDPQVKADVLRLFDTMDLKERTADTARAMFQTLRPMLMTSIPPTPKRDQIIDAYSEKLGALLTSGEYTDRIAAIYAKYFSDEDIQALSAFYQTPAGQHYLAVSPQLVRDSSQLGMRIALDNIPNIFKELCKEYPELQGVAKFCPAGERENNSLLTEPILQQLGD
jgi:hypothetical protein